MFDSTLLLKPDLRELDEITFSLDGYTPKLNDKIRGDGCFKKCVSNIRMAIELGYDVDITCCIHKTLLERDNDGNLFLDSMICFLEELGVRRINFHDLFKTGIPRDTWTGDFDPPLKEWMNAYEEIQANIADGRYNIPVRSPQCFVTREEFERNPEYYGYCSAKLGETVLIHPNGIIRICSLMIGTPYGVARFHNDKIIWDRSSTNELRDHKLDASTPCTNQSKHKSFGNLVPLCVSSKPRQKEFVWTEKISWETKRKR
jgi:MoaA/NifB/PqqE/SkfB family radical SAM enzyme